MSYKDILSKNINKPPPKVVKPLVNVSNINLEPDENIVTANDIKEYFELTKGNFIMDTYYEVKELGDNGIMQDLEYFSYSNFVDLIVDQVDISSYYKKQHKI